MLLINILYNFVYVVAYLVLFIYSAFTNNKVIKNKLFPKFKKFNDNKDVIWLHGSSVGEVFSCYSLVLELAKNYNIVITTNTYNGYNQGQQKYSSLNNVAFYYLPYDTVFLSSLFVKKINAKLVLWLEQDFFINYFKKLKQANTPIILLNARMSNKTYNRYCKIKWLARYILHYFACILCSSTNDKIKYSSLTATRVEYIGNLKYTNLDSSYNAEVFNLLLNKFARVPVLSLISTHFNEEAEIIKHINLSKLWGNTKIIVAPRHINRCGELKQQLQQISGLNCLLLSEVNDTSLVDIVIVDSMGLINTITKLSTVVYMGKSLLINNKGGHNILEPMYMQACVVVGKYMDNFIDITKLALNSNSIVMVSSYAELVTISAGLIENADAREYIQTNAGNFFKNNNILTNTINKIQCYIN